MPNKPDNSGQLFYEQARSGNQANLQTAGDEFEVTIRRFKDVMEVKTHPSDEDSVEVRGNSSGEYFVDNDPTDFDDAAVDSGIVGYSTACAGGEELPLLGTPSGSRSKLSIGTLNAMLIQAGVTISQPSEVGLAEEGLLYYNVETGFLEILIETGGPSHAWNPMFNSSGPRALKLGTGSTEGAVGNHTH